MSNFLSILKSVLTVVLAVSFYTVMIGGYVLGIAHAFKKHDTSDGLMSLLLVAPAYYWSAEKFFWHEKPVVQYDNEVKTDLKIFVMLCNEAANGKNSPESIEAVSNFKIRFSKYPPEYQVKLKNQSKSYVKYIWLIQGEIMEHLKNMTRGKSSESFRFSQNVHKSENELKQMGLEREIEDIQNTNKIVVEDMVSQMKGKTFATEEEIESADKLLNQYYETSRFALKSFYKEMYNDQL